MIDQTISTEAPETPAISGEALQANRVAFQFTPDSTGDFTIQIEAAAAAGDGFARAYAVIGTFTQDDTSRHVLIEVSRKTLYRIRHNSGVPVRAQLAG